MAKIEAVLLEFFVLQESLKVIKYSFPFDKVSLSLFRARYLKQLRSLEQRDTLGNVYA